MEIRLRHVLVVEDSENDLELMLDVLEEHKLANKIAVARDGEEALAYIFKSGKWKDRESGNPTLVLLDLKLPKKNGLEVLKEIRGNKLTANIPVVILTSSKEEQDVYEGYRLGTNAYVVKPVGFEDFARAVKTLGIFWALINQPPGNK
ncbi:response regulator [uncultured Sunxiuqinia sp.]|uniref:response regulator n=1 Tax=uncultured Sunxiuqinia sp. TaxID=1573825 RepID=UPI002AA8E1D1|nr:response regulator [uncultured Sunxiuqinia sp.]